jgi:hypothetical protein
MIDSSEISVEIDPFLLVIGFHPRNHFIYLSNIFDRSNLKTPLGHLATHSPQVRQRLSFIGTPNHAWRLIFISIGQ